MFCEQTWAMMRGEALRTPANCLALLCCFVFSGIVNADDWPQWMGPTRDGVYREAGIVTSIPKTGLPIKWRTPIAGGYSGPAVVGKRVFVTDYRRTEGEMIEAPDAKPLQKGFERIHCLDADTGQEIWKYEYPCQYEISYPAGPRATPTISNNRVYALGAQGNLVVLTADTGKLVFEIDLPKQFSAPVPIWGFSAHPLVSENLLITMVGGEGQSVVAFNPQNGQVIWKSLSSKDAGYCPPCLIKAGGVEQLLVWHPEAVASLNPADGTPYWTVPLVPDYGMSICRPQVEKDLLFVSGIENKSLMLQLDPSTPKVTELWRSKPTTSMSASTSTPLLHDGVIYGNDESLGALVAAEAADGKRLWETYEPVRPENDRRLAAGTSFVVRHQPSGNYLLFGETGLLTLATMDRSGFQSLGQMSTVEPTQTAFGRKVIWSHPAFANQTAYIRNDQEIIAVDLSASPEK